MVGNEHSASETAAVTRPVDLDALDRLNAEASHLSAMLAVIIGEGAQTFDRYSDDTRHAYLWACAERARELRGIAASL